MNPYLKYKELFDKVYKSNEIIIDADMKEHTYNPCRRTVKQL